MAAQSRVKGAAKAQSIERAGVKFGATIWLKGLRGSLVITRRNGADPKKWDLFDERRDPIVEPGAWNVQAIAESTYRCHAAYLSLRTDIMRWQGREGSRNVQDRRGMARPIAIGGGLIAVITVVLNLLMGGEVDVSQLQMPQQEQRQLSPEEKAAEDEMARFVSVVLKETENVWNAQFATSGRHYEEPTLVLFSGGVSSACGSASAATGPFYCPADRQLYIDLSFYGELRDRFGAPGDFAMAYVVAHEVGHHVQTLLGTSEKLARLRQQGVSQEEYNAASVRFELQADFLAGVWAHHTARKDLLDEGDFEEAMRAANAIGDDRLQREAGGRVVPESFTHGTSEQRMYWFRKGFETGDVSQGDTFASDR